MPPRPNGGMPDCQRPGGPRKCGKQKAKSVSLFVIFQQRKLRKRFPGRFLPGRRRVSCTDSRLPICSLRRFVGDSRGFFRLPAYLLRTSATSVTSANTNTQSQFADGLSRSGRVLRSTGGVKHGVPANDIATTSAEASRLFDLLINLSRPPGKKTI